MGEFAFIYFILLNMLYYNRENHKGADIMQPIFLKPVLQEKIWGGKKLQTEFNLNLTSDKVGESWSISAHPNGQSTVLSPSEFQGMTLACPAYSSANVIP